MTTENSLIHILRQSSIQRSLCLLLLALGMSACSVTKVANAYFQSTTSFYLCTPDPRISCQPGSEALAKAIASSVEAAQQKVEQQQYCQFVKPVLIRTYASSADFARFSGSVEYAEGAVSFGVLHVSPKLLGTPERIPGIMTHELSHLNLSLEMGTWSWAQLPGWFHEGLATWVSSGGGAETVSIGQAISNLQLGQRFVPELKGSPFSPKTAASYQLKPHMYYRQASLFVAYLHDRSPDAFRQMIVAIEHGSRFADAFNAAYPQGMGWLWADFLATVQVQNTSRGSSYMEIEISAACINSAENLCQP